MFWFPLATGGISNAEDFKSNKCNKLKKVLLFFFVVRRINAKIENFFFAGWQEEGNTTTQRDKSRSIYGPTACGANPECFRRKYASNLFLFERNVNIY